VTLTGADALRAAAMILPTVNAAGAKRSQVSAAADPMQQAASVESLFDRYAPRERPRWKNNEVPGKSLTSLPREVALALEMATHEDAERRALEGELALLETRGATPRRLRRTPTTCSCPVPSPDISTN
jgi:hypothetical protein